MDWQNSLDCFQLQNNFLIDNQIDPVAAIELETFVQDWELNLAFEGHPAQMQFVAQALFISGLWQPRAQVPVHLNGCSDNGTGSRVSLFFAFSVAL